MISRLIVMLSLAGAASAGSAKVVEPKQVSSPASVRSGHGVLILSIRSQDQLFGKLTIWFEADDEVARRSAADIKFDRKDGIPLAGINMVDLKPAAYSVPAGRWRLLAHAVSCTEIPPADAVCKVTGGYGGRYPAGRYALSTILLDIRPGAIFDGGDLVLEFPEGTDLTQDPKEDTQLTMRLRWKPLPPAEVARISARFPGFQATALQGVAANERSSVRCARKEGKLHHGTTVPFDC